MNIPGQSEKFPFVGPHSGREKIDISHYLHRPIVFQEPDRLVDPPSWVEHIPFAFWLVDALGPEILVELGRQSGNSYAAFAQAVQALRLPTACYAIDTWKGDPHTGPYDENVFNEWRDYHDRHFSAFSRLIRTSFSEACKQFANGSIDLLHVDGYHTFGAAHQDLPMWLPKMSHRGVVLLHDINVREQDFGAWQLWHQVERTYPSFAFLHGHGLGVLGVGRDLPEPIEWLLSRRTASPEDLSETRLFFSRLGRRLSLEHECARHEQTIRALRSRLPNEPGDEPTRAFHADLEDKHAPCEQKLLALESRLLNECEQREQTIGELDAEARALATQLENMRAKMTGRRTWVQRCTAPVASRLRAARRSRIWRAGAVLRTTPALFSMAVGGGNWRGSAKILARFAARPRRASEASLVARSGLFDDSYYLAQNPDVANSRIHPLVHYVLWGAFEGRRPIALFDPAYYLEQYPDVARARFEPLSHFLRHGTSEERNPGPHFDSRYYLATNPDVRESGVNPLVHFVQGGWREGRSPSPSFDCTSYVARYEDVRSSGVNPLVHYVEVGRVEGRDAAPVMEASLPSPPRVRLTSQPIFDRRPERPDQPLILCLTHVCPWPPHAGNAYRISRMLQWLRHSGFRVVPVIVPLDGETPEDEAIRKVEQLFSNVVVIDRNGDIRYSLADVPDVLASLNGEHTPRYSALLGEEESISGRERELLTIDRTYCPDAVIAAILRLHSVLGDYVLLAEYVWMTRLFPLIDARAIKVLDTHDVFSTKKDKVLRFGIRDLWLDPEEEARRLVLADLVIAIQNEEREILQQLVPDRRVVTAGIDFDVVGDPRLPDAHRILYVASGNPMNVRGLRDFLRFAWPSIQRQVPDAELLVAGAVSETLDQGLSGVLALGRVKDLDELYRSVRVVINPVLAGTGGKIKTVEALSRLRPIVTWPTGVDGLPRELRDLCDVVRDWYEFGPRVVSRLVTDRQEAFSPAERRLIEHATSPDTVYADLSANLRELWQRRVTSAEVAVAGRS